MMTADGDITHVLQLLHPAAEYLTGDLEVLGDMRLCSLKLTAHQWIDTYHVLMALGREVEIKVQLDTIGIAEKLLLGNAAHHRKPCFLMVIAHSRLLCSM